MRPVLNVVYNPGGLCFEKKIGRLEKSHVNDSRTKKCNITPLVSSCSPRRG